MKIKIFLNKFRIVLGVLLIAMSVLMLISRWLRFPIEIGICDDFLCESFWLDGVALPLYFGLPYLIVSILFLICLPYSYLKIWMKIMIPYFVVTLIILMATPALCDGMICWDRTLVASGFAKLFLILTIIIILIKAIYLHIASRQNK